MVTDFRQLNEITVDNSYPLPLTTDIIESVTTAQYMTAIDLKMGFYQIPMDPEDAHKTAFVEPYGPLRVHANRQGPAQRTRNLSGPDGPRVEWTTGRRIILLSRRYHSLRNGLRRARKEIQSTYEKTRRRQRNFPVATSKKKIKQFLGLAGYYRRFVKGFVTIVWPLSNLLREHHHSGKRPFVWGEA